MSRQPVKTAMRNATLALKDIEALLLGDPNESISVCAPLSGRT
jgi:hypothetical protein